MKRRGTLEAVSYKTNRVLVSGEWVPIDTKITLKNLDVGKSYMFILESGFISPFVIRGIEEENTVSNE